jgi:DNA-binding CsgD family transcriptional regulator
VDQKPPETPLSPREIEILEKVAYGATTKEVAEQLGISPRAVKKELDRIFEKLGASHPPRGMAIAARSASVVQPRKTPGGDTIRLCQEHRCCYEVVLRVGAGVPLNRAGEWHFRWSEETRKWRLQDPARQIKTERDVPEGVSPTVALFGAILGKAISDIAEQIERLGFPPPDWGSGRT